ncbi:MAG: TIGR03545 family protein, partial [Pseudobdellovibrionaceae bacterium]|nr:TIGR03545 family protein [Pseudobdellovibrionaceae bacterium]
SNLDHTEKKPPVSSQKKQSITRYEAVLPTLIIAGLMYIYFLLFFDKHLKWAIETLGYEVTGAEVNVGNLSTSFFNASITIKELQFTNPEKPT